MDSRAPIPLILSVLRDARWFGRERAVGYAKLLAVIWIPLLVIPYALAIGVQPGFHPAVDFMSFWSAGVLTWRDPASVYDAATQIAFQAKAFHMPGRYLPFMYPPPLLLLLAPLGLAPFWAAYAGWMTATYGVYLAAARRLLRDGFWPIAVFPAVYVNAVQGQTAALFAGLFVGASLSVARRPFLAGLMFGALVFKPQLGLMIPVALIAARQWRAVLGAAMSSLGLLALALLAFGPHTYQAFLASSSASVALLQTGALPWGKFQSLYGAARQIGAPAWAAGLAQATLALAAAAIVFQTWRRNADPLTRTAVLATAALVSTPYLLDYDLVLLIAPVCWLARRGLQRGFRPWERLGLAALFFMPTVCRGASLALGVNLAPLAVIWVLATLALASNEPGSTGDKLEPA